MVYDERKVGAPYSSHHSQRFRLDTLTHKTRSWRDSTQPHGYKMILKAFWPQDYERYASLPATEVATGVLRAYEKGAENMYTDQLKQMARLLGYANWNALTKSEAASVIEQLFKKEHSQHGGSIDVSSLRSALPMRPDSSARSALIKHIQRQSGWTGSKSHGNDYYMFVLDASTSMGKTSSWSLDKCSRICLGIGLVASMVDQLHPSDKYAVVTFDTDLTEAVEWTVQGRMQCGSAFDADELASEIADVVDAFRGSGSDVFTVFLHGGHWLAKQAVQSPGGKYSLVLVTDGEAGDTNKLDEAKAFVRDPPFDSGGLQVALIEIFDHNSDPGSHLRALERAPGGQGRLPYVRYMPMSMPTYTAVQASPEVRRVVQSTCNFVCDRACASAVKPVRRRV